MFEILDAKKRTIVKEYMEFIGVDGKQYRVSITNGKVIGIFDATTDKRLKTKAICSLTGLSMKELEEEIDEYYYGEPYLDDEYDEYDEEYEYDDYEYEDYEPEYEPTLRVIKGGKSS